MNRSTLILAVALASPLAVASKAHAQPTPGALGVDAAPSGPAPSGPAVDVVKNFYQAFQKSDFATMESLYSPDAKWQDTIFSADDREKLMGIWRFELNPSVGGKVTYQIVGASAPDAQGNTEVQVKWRDVYKFLGNPIDHSIDATLTVDRSGHIVNHVESYSWSEWAHQAFPWAGNLVDNPVAAPVLRFLLRRVVDGAVLFDDVKRALDGTKDDAAKPASTDEAAKADSVRPDRPATPGINHLLERDMAGHDRAER